MKDISEILADIRSHSGGVSLHLITKAAGDGRHFLEPAGLRAMLPKEDELCHPCEPETFEKPSEISLVTVNVDGLGDYETPLVQRVAAILDEVHRSRPEVFIVARGHNVDVCGDSATPSQLEGLQETRSG